MDNRRSRRDVLRWGAAIAAAALTGCSDAERAAAPRGRASPAMTPTPMPTVASPTATTATRSTTWAQLAARVRGDVVRPDDAGYRRARHLFNPRFDDARPQGIVYCESADDVRRTVAFARDTELPLAVRSGGHSYGGWSTGRGVVLDVSRFSRIRVDATTAHVGAGARLIDVYDVVGRRGLGLVAGSCATVGISGLTLGGGIGVLTRAWGLTCDSLVALDVVTADGELLVADAHHEPDLFWASRGGGGGNFGVVTALRFRLRRAPRVTTWYYRWRWSSAGDVVDGWQTWADSSPRRMWSSCKLLTSPGESSASAQVSGTWLGSTAELAKHLRSLVAAVGHAPVERSRTTRSYLATMFAEAGCSGRSAARCTTPRTSYAGTSHVLHTPMTGAGAATAVAWVQRRQAQQQPRQAGVSFAALGGAVADVAADATAFPHRDALAVAQYNVGWPYGQSPQAVAGDLAWLSGFRDAMTPVVGNSAYVNYPDPTLGDWHSAYYGANYPRLQAVKRRYDPDALFSFPQSIRA